MGFNPISSALSTIQSAGNPVSYLNMASNLAGNIMSGSCSRHQQPPANGILPGADPQQMQANFMQQMMGMMGMMMNKMSMMFDQLMQRLGAPATPMPGASGPDPVATPPAPTTEPAPKTEPEPGTPPNPQTPDGTPGNSNELLTKVVDSLSGVLSMLKDLVSSLRGQPAAATPASTEPVATPPAGTPTPATQEPVATPAPDTAAKKKAAKKAKLSTLFRSFGRNIAKMFASALGGRSARLLRNFFKAQKAKK